MASPGNQPLPSKEATLFRQVVKFYETKQYKKAVKAADQILKKFPDHGETLAMKGLTLNYMDKKDEAYELVRKGLKSDLRSHVCWHVYGLLYRSDMNYTEAIKCYLNALRHDKENIQILRDLAMLQIQMRDIPGFVETRYKLLQLKPNNRNHWISFAVGHHLEGNHELAAQIMTAYESTQEEIPSSEAYEHSELLLYKAQVLQEGGHATEALTLLQTEKDKIKDHLGYMTAEAALLLELGSVNEAEHLYRKLLALNPDNYHIHEALQRCQGLQPQIGEDGHGLSDEPRRRLTELYVELLSSYPRSMACQRIPLTFKVGDAFEQAADTYVRRCLIKGIPSLFSDLKPLYTDASKAQVLGSLFDSYLQSLESNGCLPPAASAAADQQQQQQQPSASSPPPQQQQQQPTPSSTSAAANNGADTDMDSHANGKPLPESTSGSTVSGQDGDVKTWVLHYLAQHHDRLGNLEAALSAVDAGIRHAPEVIELYTNKARILKHAGDPKGAAYYADKARRMDLADRYLNSMAVKALFRAGRIHEAENTAMLFTREGDQVNNLSDMQHMWYEIHCGEAYLAQQQYGKALKKFLAVGKHFADINEDQFDFHSYCIRKMTLRAYVGMLRLEDQLYSQAFYGKAAWGAVQCYLSLHDAPISAAAQEAADEAALAAMTPEERKKEKLRRKKEEKRREREAAEREAAAKAAEVERRAAEKEASSSNGTTGGAAKKKGAAAARPIDPDPDGAKLAAVDNPLAEATKLVDMLKQHARDKLPTQLAAFEVYSRKGKTLLALSAVKRAVDIAGAEHPDVHRCVVKFALQVQQQPPVSEVVQSVMDDVLPALLGNTPSLQVYVDNYQQQHARKSIAHCAAAAEMHALLDSNCKPEAVKSILDAVSSNSANAKGAAAADVSQYKPGKGHQVYMDVHALLLKGPLADEAAAAEFKQRCAQLFPWSAHFEGAQQVVVDAASSEANGVVEATTKLSLN